MSVVSSKISSVSSILKTPGVRSKLSRPANKVYFKLPQDLRTIILNFESGESNKEYNNLLSILQTYTIKDSDLLEFLIQVKECAVLFGPVHSPFIEALLKIKWIKLSSETLTSYKECLEDLMCLQSYHVKLIIGNLVVQIKPEENENEWVAGECSEQDKIKLGHIHDIFQKVLKVIPLSSKILLQSIRAKFPYMTHDTHTHEIYVYALLQIPEYAPQLQLDILSLIINRLMILDVNIPKVEEESECEDEAMEDDNECENMSQDHNEDNSNENQEKSNTPTIHLMAHTLDICIELVLNYIHNVCFEKDVLQVESLRKIYFDMLKICEAIILPTYASQYVQYIVLYICSFKPVIIESFVEWLWQKASDPNVSSVIRQSSLAYIRSLLATAVFASSTIVQATQLKMAKWIHNYIAIQDAISYGCDDTKKEHTVFYSICQSLFFIVIERHKDFINTRNILCLHELDLPKIITCKLNPLKFCQPEIVCSFADITRTYQLAYCYTVIENNQRIQLPVLEAGQHVSTLNYDSFLPFGEFALPQSGQKILPLIRQSTISKYKTQSRHRNDSIGFMSD
ncbi:RNA polymerase I-specific transcription initiation factor RRN3 isoform X1 [Prorops nasuta]|uniref:RNA polymerase I-specific transcription initiation factor RRN3 isoform X1 n=1 Tax=Prorops nasuta TaxID=863751 RepID=UPI0034CFAF4A